MRLLLVVVSRRGTRPAASRRRSTGSTFASTSSGPVPAAHPLADRARGRRRARTVIAGDAVRARGRREVGVAGSGRCRSAWPIGAKWWTSAPYAASSYTTISSARRRARRVSSSCSAKNSPPSPSAATVICPGAATAAPIAPPRPSPTALEAVHEDPVARVLDVEEHRGPAHEVPGVDRDGLARRQEVGERDREVARVDEAVRARRPRRARRASGGRRAARRPRPCGSRSPRVPRAASSASDRLRDRAGVADDGEVDAAVRADRARLDVDLHDARAARR